jgi:YVTN family beta-propeller protein
MEFRILGPLEVESDGQVLPIGSRQPRALLTLLLLDANRVVSRDRLFEALWGEEPPETAANALQVYVSQLRKALGHDLIATQQRGYQIHVEEGQLDLERFDRLVDEARLLEPDGAARTLRQALLLWRGEPLADLTDVPLVEGERHRLEELRLSTLEARIEADLALGEHASLVPELEALVREHPLRERLRGQLMLALYRSGRQAEALEVYRQGRRLLADELGLEPGEALKRLEKAILEHDPALAPAAPPPSEGGRRSVPTGTVTLLFTDVEGSTRLIEDLRDDYGTLLDEHNRLVRKALLEHGGLEIAGQGDAFFFAFRRARDAVTAAIAAQRAVLTADWPRAADVRIRIGIHTGEPGVAEGGYHGIDVVRAARISAAAHGGQTLVSNATRDLVGSAVPDVSFRDLGEHRLPEIDEPQVIFQALAPGLPDGFPALRTDDDVHVMPIGGREAELAAAAEAAVGAEERRLRLFRRSRIAAAVGSVIVVGAAVAIAVALTQGGPSVGRVRPNSIAVIDPKTDRLVADVGVGSRPVAVAVGEGGVWVANADDGTVSRIDPRTRKVVSTIGIGADLSDVTVGYGSVWVADGNDGTLTRIDPKLNAVEATLRFGTTSELVPEPVFSVATGAGAVWITRGNRLIRIDPATGRAASFPIPAPVAIAVGAGAVWVTTQDERLLRIDSATGARTGSLSLPSTGFAPKVGVGALWLILPLATGAVWRIDPATVTPTANVAVKSFPNDLAVGDGAVWAAGGDGTVLRIDPVRAVVQKTIRLGLQPAAVAAGVGGVWVAVQRPS